MRDDAATMTTSATSALASAERRITAAETYLVVARAAVQAGSGRATDVMGAEVGLDEARLGRARALHQQALAEAERRRALGVTNPTRDLQENAP